MDITAKIRKIVITASLLLALPALSACGGGDSAPAEEPAGLSVGAVIVCAFLFVLVDGRCVPKDDAEPATDDPPPADPEPDSKGPTWTVRNMSELEPNDTLGNAQPMNFPVPAPQDTYVSVRVQGALNDVTDLIDTYIFVAPDYGDYSLVLCEPGVSCDGLGTLNTTVAFFRLLDLDGNVLFTTQGDELGRNWSTSYLDTGIAYYVSVHAGDTTGMDLNYRFGIRQMENTDARSVP